MGSNAGFETVSAAPAARSNSQGQLFALLGFTIVLLLTSIAIVSASRSYADAIGNNGDNAVYATVASGIQRGNTATLGWVKQFWGFPYAVAALCRVLPINIVQAMAAISIASTLGAVWLAFEMWGLWVAAYFIAGSYMLIQFGSFAGADPLFAFLFLLTLYLARAEKWNWAMLAISLATVVRPLGMFGLLAIFVQLLRLRKPRRLVASAIICAVTLGIYFASLAHYTGRPFTSFSTYRVTDWSDGLPITAPLLGIVANAINRMHVGSNGFMEIKVCYVLLHLAALIFLFSSRKRWAALAAAAPVEFFALALYSVFILCYSAPEWALSIYPRLLIPISPILLSIFGSALPRRWAAVAALGVCSAVLGALSNLGPAQVKSLF